MIQEKLLLDKQTHTYISMYTDETTVLGEKHVLLIFQAGNNEFSYVRNAESIVKHYFTEHKDVVIIKRSFNPIAKTYLISSDINDIILKIKENKEQYGISDNFVVLQAYHVGANIVVEPLETY